jgi:hypothetical protein
MQAIPNGRKCVAVPTPLRARPEVKRAAVIARFGDLVEGMYVR